MAPLAIYLSQKGYSILGWDDHVNPVIKDLLLKYHVVFLPKKELPEGCDMVVRSSAIDVDEDPICQAAVRKGITILRRGEMLACEAKGKSVMAIVGSHGKTSVTASCIDLLMANHVDFSYVLGGFFKNNVLSPACYHPESSLLVIEVDESDGTMNEFSPTYTIALNYDDDHIGNYNGHEGLVHAFHELFSRTSSKIVAPKGDKILDELLQNFPLKAHRLSSLPEDDFTQRNQEIAAQALNIFLGGEWRRPDHFTPIFRRTDILMQTDDFVAMMDYAHHPTEVAALLKYVRKQYPQHRAIVVFQPHRVSRTQQYYKEFAEVLDQFDQAYVVELYAAFEHNPQGVSSQWIVDAMKTKTQPVISLDYFQEEMQAAFDDERRKPGKSLFLFVGAGNIISKARGFVSTFGFNFAQEYLQKSGITCEAHKDVTRMLSIRVPAVARLWVVPQDVDELKKTLKICSNMGLRVTFLGNGTKVVPGDSLLNQVVVQCKSPKCQSIEWLSEDTVEVFAGAMMGTLCRKVLEHEWTGMERLAGIPCSIGGAIVMNAGAHGQTISDHLVSIMTLDSQGEEHIFYREQLHFRYRHCDLPRGHVIVKAIFQFNEKQSFAEMMQLMQFDSAWRQTHQPKAPNTGSVFKNNSSMSAGEMIDQLGLKRLTSGGMMVSPEHANFIINLGNGTAKEMEQLMDYVRYAVFEAYGEFLESEVIFLR